MIQFLTALIMLIAITTSQYFWGFESAVIGCLTIIITKQLTKD